MKMKFSDAPVGARFRFLHYKPERVYVKIHANQDTDGLIARWYGNEKRHQPHHSFADKELGITLDTEIELI